MKKIPNILFVASISILIATISVVMLVNNGPLQHLSDGQAVSLLVACWSFVGAAVLLLCCEQQPKAKRSRAAFFASPNQPNRIRLGFGIEWTVIRNGQPKRHAMAWAAI